MLNRHILRIKAMQMLYSLEQCQRAAYEIATDQLNQSLEPEWNVNRETIDYGAIQKKRQFAQAIFEQNYRQERLFLDATIDDEVKKVATETFVFYKNQLNKDKTFLQKQLEQQFEKMYNAYLMLLLLIIDLSDFVRQEEERIRSSIAYQNQVIEIEGDFKFKNNRFCQILKNDNMLQKELLRRNLSWNNYRDVVHNLYRQVIKNEAFYKQYNQAPATDFEQDREVVTTIVRNVLLKNETVQNVLEEIDSHWAENATAVRDMLNKNLKKTSPEAGFNLMPLSVNWNEDLDFMKEIVKLTWEKYEELDEVIQTKAQNWDTERLAMIDKLIIKMAICEMLYFPSIPTKVSINEYIEISKTYSTPKSKQFVNGLLDAIAQELQQQGRIRKTGRGLMDNK